MADKAKEFDEYRLVKAHNAFEAEDKYKKFWEDKASEYSVYYHAYGDVVETIE
jgi:hypothetical protein